VSDVLVAAGHPVLSCCRVLGVSKPGYYRYKHRALAPTKMRRQWLTGLIQEVHAASRGTYGYRRVHAEQTMGMGVTVSSRLKFGSAEPLTPGRASALMSQEQHESGFFLSSSAVL
jgi:putative transposase